jgi:TRAP transporter TAXI family solute receptor
MLHPCVAFFALVIMTLFMPTGLEARTQYVTIGTGDVTGVYYASGIAIAKLLNQQREKHQLFATVESTKGSVYNVNAIISGELEFGMVQSDRQYQAYKGLADWQGQPQQQLRAIFSLHPESVTVVALEAKKIKTLADLKGRTVNIGNPGSGQRGNAIDILSTAGIDFRTALNAEDKTASEAVDLFLKRKMDAFFYTVGHPNIMIKEAVAGAHRVRFVTIPQAIITALTEKFPYYTPARISIDLYPEVANLKDVATLGVRATLCTRADVPEGVVYALTKEIFANFAAFKASHQAYRDLEKASLLEGLTAPLHPGALKYYREVGLLE